jgi:hypothetical protein
MGTLWKYNENTVGCGNLLQLAMENLENCPRKLLFSHDKRVFMIFSWL